MREAVTLIFALTILYLLFMVEILRARLVDAQP
jgi:hypothetical protein